MKIAKPDLPAVQFITRNMREWDRAEIYAMRWGDDPDALAADMVAISQFGFVMGVDRPIAMVGATPLWGGVWSVWAFATDEFRLIQIGLTKFIKRRIIPALYDAGAHRAQCWSIEGHTEAHAWLEFLSAVKQEGPPVKGLGRNGEDFRLYAWSRDDVYRRRPKS